MKLFFLAFGLVIALISQTAGAAVELYDGFVFGRSIEEISSEHKMSSCSPRGFSLETKCGESLYRGATYTSVASFYEGKLVGITFLGAFVPELVMREMSILGRSFSLLKVSGASEDFDVLEMLRKNKNERNFSADLEKFEARNLAGRGISWNFIEASEVSVLSFLSADEAMKALGPDVRAVRCSVYSDLPGRNVSAVTYYLPKRFNMYPLVWSF